MFELFVEQLRDWKVSSRQLNGNEQYILDALSKMNVGEIKTLPQGWDLVIYRVQFGSDHVRFFIQRNILSGTVRVNVLYTADKREEAKAFFDLFKETKLYKEALDKVSGVRSLKSE